VSRLDSVLTARLGIGAGGAGGAGGGVEGKGRLTRTASEVRGGIGVTRHGGGRSAA